MEDLTNFDKGKFNIKNEEFKMHYTRLTRLLRLGNIKKWMKEQGEKLGIRVHITPSPYTSQKCPKCSTVDKNNRPTQEKFECVECHFTDEADFVSPVNILTNFTSDVLREKLHTADIYGRCQPKKLKRGTIKKIVSSCHEASLRASSNGYPVMV